MGSSGHHKEKTFADTFLAILLVVLALIVIFFIATNIDPFVEMMGQYFQLTPDDLVMIPFGIVVFYAFWRVCKRVIFDPCLLLIEEREAATEGAENSANEYQQQAKQLREDYQDHFQKARAEALSKKQKSIVETKNKAGIEVEDALKKAEQLSKKAAESLQQEIEVIKNNALSDVDTMVNSIIDRVERS